MPNARPADVQRLFFALWPSDALRRQLARNCKHLLRHGGGRPVDVENLHITLAFLGSVTAEQRACAERVADAVRLPRFSLSLDRAGYWARPRVLWLAPGEQPETAAALANRLTAGARDCGLTMDTRPFQAHLTVMRKVAKAPVEMTVEPLLWEVENFVLVQSQTHSAGVQYTPLRTWLLQ